MANNYTFPNNFSNGAQSSVQNNMNTMNNSLQQMQQMVQPQTQQQFFLQSQGKFDMICGCKNNYKITVGDFVRENPEGIYLITMNGHITCAINGHIYDTFDPSDRLVWGAYRVK